MSRRYKFLKIFIPIVILAAGILASFLTARQVYQVENGRAHDTAQSIVHSRLMMFQQLLDKRMTAGSDLKTLIFSRNGDISDIDATVEEIFRYQSPMVTDIGLAPDGRVTYVYPNDWETAAKMKGVYLFGDSNPAMRDQLIFSRDSQRTVLIFPDTSNSSETSTAAEAGEADGTGETGQGAETGDEQESQEDRERDLVIYSPVYLREEGTGYENFWGFIILQCPYDAILEEARITELPEDHYRYRLTVHSFYGNATQTLAESSADWSDAEAEQYTVEMPGYEFILSVSPVAGWYSRSFVAAVAAGLLALTMALSALVGILFRLNRSNHLLAELSAKDDLTGLPNRRSFRANIEYQLAQEKPLTIFFLDANHFKEVNDTLGHKAGNIVLQEYAVRLNEIFDGQAYRLGGDEFAGYFQEKLSGEEIEAALNRVDQILDRPFVCRGNSVHLSMAAGWAVPEPGKTYDQLMQEADALMYRNKEAYHQREAAARQ